MTAFLLDRSQTFQGFRNPHPPVSETRLQVVRRSENSAETPLLGNQSNTRLYQTCIPKKWLLAVRGMPVHARTIPASRSWIKLRRLLLHGQPPARVQGLRTRVFERPQPEVVCSISRVVDSGPLETLLSQDSWCQRAPSKLWPCWASNDGK